MTGMTGTQNLIQTRQPASWKREESQVEDRGLREACAAFESIFIHYMLQSARKAIPEDGLFDNTHESRIYKSMMDEQMARAVARGRGVGLGALLYNQLSEEKANGAADVSEYV
jgi:flagellar protein FlgJ